MVGLTSQIRKELSDENKIEQINKLEKIEEHMLSFLNNVYELAQMENGEIDLNEIPIDISQAVEKTYALIEKEIKEKNITVQYWSDIKHPYIYQDIMHTTTCVMNVLYNAIKYTPEGGTIRFGLQQIMDDLSDSCTIDFICEDNGIGIAPEFVPYICKNFAREDNEVNQEIPSAGLGLSITKGLLYLMNGTINVKSELGKGTTITVSIPHRCAEKKDVEKTTSLTGNVIL